jgi:hypothetical protein
VASGRCVSSIVASLRKVVGVAENVGLGFQFLTLFTVYAKTNAGNLLPLSILLVRCLGAFKMAYRGPA